jgi:hypothetical protein
MAPCWEAEKYEGSNTRLPSVQGKLDRELRALPRLAGHVHRPPGRLVIATAYDKGHTQTKRTRYMPVHPTLAALLAKWKLKGWPEMIGRAPTPEDLVVPIWGHMASLHRLAGGPVAGQTPSSGKSVRSNSSSGPSGRQPGGGGVARSAAMTCLARSL